MDEATSQAMKIAVFGEPRGGWAGHHSPTDTLTLNTAFAPALSSITAQGDTAAITTSDAFYVLTSGL